jgi:hypothetical protein
MQCMIIMLPEISITRLSFPKYAEQRYNQWGELILLSAYAVI